MPTTTGHPFVASIGSVVTVPDDDIARLMYYLRCATLSLDFYILPDDLVDFQKYHKLSPARRKCVFKTAMEFSPVLLDDKVIFKDDTGIIVTRPDTNKFLGNFMASTIVNTQKNVLLGGEVRTVTKVMFYKSSWLRKYYKGPIGRLARTYGWKHCRHCEGVGGFCTCGTCPRTSSSTCLPCDDLDDPFNPIFPRKLEAWRTRVRRDPYTSEPSPSQHPVHCDGCGSRCFTGMRYKCMVCRDYDFCMNCYRELSENHGHDFKRYEYPGAPPVLLSARTRAGQAPTTTNQAPPPASPRVRSPQIDGAPVPTRSPQAPPHSSGPSADLAARTLFYQSMSISELKAFLGQRGVPAEKLLDEETLCKRVWETHIDSLSLSEIDIFLAESGISINGCRDARARRNRAKGAFQPPTRSQASARVHGSRVWEADDEVVLVALRRAEMNGRRGIIQSVDSGAGKAMVWVWDVEKSFRVKFENLAPWVAGTNHDMSVVGVEDLD